MAKKGLGVSSDENKALRERDKYRSLFEESIDAIFITDRNGVFLEVNQATLTLFGYTIEEMKNSLKASDLYVHPGDRETFRVEIEQKGAVRDYPARLRKKDGTQMRCLLNFTVRLSDDGGISGYQGIIRDVTEQQRAQEELQRANNELKTFIDVISHELKNPILVIQGFANRLMNNQGQMLGEKGRYYLEHIQTNARRMESLVCELLLLSKAGRADYHFKQVSCLDIVNNVTSSLREDLEDEQIALVVEEDLPTAYCDPRGIFHVFENLIVNAIKHAASDRTLRIEIGHETGPAFLQFFVRDNGIGIAPEYHQKIFEKFFSLNQPSGKEGTGLGLAIVERIVNNHGGTVWVESERGKGATFYFTLRRPK